MSSLLQTNWKELFSEDEMRRLVMAAQRGEPSYNVTEGENPAKVAVERRHKRVP